MPGRSVARGGRVGTMTTVGVSGAGRVWRGGRVAAGVDVGVAVGVRVGMAVGRGVRVGAGVSVGSGGTGVLQGGNPGNPQVGGGGVGVQGAPNTSKQPAGGVGVHGSPLAGSVQSDWARAGCAARGRASSPSKKNAKRIGFQFLIIFFMASPGFH